MAFASDELGKKSGFFDKSMSSYSSLTWSDIWSFAKYVLYIIIFLVIIFTIYATVAYFDNVGRSASGMRQRSGHAVPQVENNGYVRTQLQRKMLDKVNGNGQHGASD